MKTIPFISEVEIFNETMGKSESNSHTPTIPDTKSWMFIYNFILEELNEYKEACEDGDIIEVADALGDIMYVLCNGIMQHGLKDRFQDLYNEIQRSNLSKACSSEQEAIETAKHEAERVGEATYFEQIKENVWVVYRQRDKKILKSINYSRPNLAQFFTKEEIENCTNK
jgi:predicted HAD superfamily Cof-like phosphohydrolase